MDITTKQVALCTATFLTLATAGAAFAGAAAASKAATTAYAILALSCAGADTAAITAWHSLKGKNINLTDYGNEFVERAAIAIPAFLLAGAVVMIIASTHISFGAAWGQAPDGAYFLDLTGDFAFGS